MKLRPEVKRFAQIMEARLRANDHKAGWDDMGPPYLIQRALEEVAELKSAEFDYQINEYSTERCDAVANEAADVANFCMMVTDNCHGLPEALDTPLEGDDE